MNTELGNSNLMPCETCGRTFNSGALQRHQDICKKIRTKTEIRAGKMTKLSGSPSNQKKDACETKTDASPAADASKPSGAGGPAGNAAALQQCPHCKRNFNFRAYDRHVSWCKTKASERIFSFSARSEADLKWAKQRCAARTSYKPPMPKSASV